MANDSLMTALEAVAWGVHIKRVEIENYLRRCFRIERFGPCDKVFRVPSLAQNPRLLITEIVMVYVGNYTIFQNPILFAGDSATPKKPVVKVDRNCNQYVHVPAPNNSVRPQSRRTGRWAPISTLELKVRLADGFANFAKRLRAVRASVSEQVHSLGLIAYDYDLAACRNASVIGGGTIDRSGCDGMARNGGL